MLEFLILIAARSGEVRGMSWDEVDLAIAVWTVSANHMKTKMKHRVPLSLRAVEIITEQQSKANHLHWASMNDVQQGDIILYVRTFTKLRD
jgi:integrase